MEGLDVAVKKSKKRNPQDATMRNVQATKRQIDSLARRIAKLEREAAANRPLMKKMKKFFGV